MALRRLSVITAVILFAAAVYRVGSSSADEWLPISPEELKMTGVPEAPGAPAVILYRQVDRDDSNIHTPHESNYIRIKIFTEEGRKYADVEIPFVKDSYNIVNIRARTIHPDGSIVNFDGKVYEKELVKGRGYQVSGEDIYVFGRAAGKHHRVPLHDRLRRILCIRLALDFERRPIHKVGEVYAEAFERVRLAMELAEWVAGRCLRRRWKPRA